MNDLFTQVACPLCNGAAYDVLARATYPPGITAAELAAAYRASSDHLLLDQLVRCSACGLVYVNPRPNDDIIVNSYRDAVDPAFVAQNPERIQTFSRSLRKAIRDLGIEPEGKRLLDVGCAGGAFPKAAHDLGFTVTGIEPSRWLAEYGRAQYGLDIRQGLLRPGLFERHSFDVVTLWDVIEHVPCPEQLLTTIHKILKPGGHLLVNYPDIGSLAARALGRKWPFLLSVHLTYYTRESMDRQLRQAGFTGLEMSMHWQALRLGYIAQRMVPYIGAARHLKALAESVGLAGVPVTYNMGQTMVTARKPS